MKCEECGTKIKDEYLKCEVCGSIFCTECYESYEDCPNHDLPMLILQKL